MKKNSLTKKQLFTAIKHLPKTKSEAYIKRVIFIVLELFNPKKYYITTTKNLRLSRESNVNNILKRRLRTCGSTVTIFALIFRKLGFKVKLIDGKIKKYGKWRRHAWLKILLPIGWKAFDPFIKNFSIKKSTHKKLGEYSSWKEMKLK